MKKINLGKKGNSELEDEEMVRRFSNERVKKYVLYEEYLEEQKLAEKKMSFSMWLSMKEFFKEIEPDINNSLNIPSLVMRKKYSLILRKNDLKTK